MNIGEIYSARFTDDVFYRARILKELPGGKYYLQYVDYGNYDRVEKKNIGMISEELRKVKSSLYRCSLFGVEGVTVRGEELFKEYIGAELVARFKEAS